MKLTKGKKIAIGISILVLLLAAGLTTFYFCYKVEQRTDGFVLELGEGLTRDPFDYVIGMDWSVQKSQLDFSNLKEDAVGEYEVCLKHGWQEFTYMVSVIDTTPPELSLWEKDYYLQRGKVYELDFFLENVFDLSGDVELEITSEQSLSDNARCLTYEENGEYQIAVTATDASGNYSTCTTKVLVDSPPVITGMKEHYLVRGYNTDFLKDIVALDELDGDVSNSLSVDVSQMDRTEPGEYTIVYKATDRFGFEGESTTTVHVMEIRALQDKIARHEIDRFTHNIVGAFNLYDAGFYETDDVEFIQDTMEVCVVRLSRPGKSYGSGFIIRITDEDVILCTNQHVTHSDKKMDVFFHDGSRYEAELVSKDYDKDMAFLKVPISDIDAEVFDTLRTVHIDEGYWKNLKDTDQGSICIRTINENGKVWRDREGKMLNKADTPEAKYRGFNYLTRMDMNVFAGSSGSAVFDGHGRLMGMVVMRVSRGGEYISFWAIPLYEILRFYQDTFSETVNYH